MAQSFADSTLAESNPFHDAARLAADLQGALDEVICGKPDAIGLAVVALLSGGHLLIEDVPGVGKTMLAKALARSIGGSFRRVQATPDLLPGELTGVSVFSREREEWRFRPGALFANVVLVDEVNRATPRTQSALLEAMQERQITVDSETHDLPDPFFLVATQNPFEFAGTFPLVEGQRDRFALVVAMGHPSRDAERELLLGRGGLEALDRIEPVVGDRRAAGSGRDDSSGALQPGGGRLHRRSLRRHPGPPRGPARGQPARQPGVARPVLRPTPS